jgi:hypothetical protein
MECTTLDVLIPHGGESVTAMDHQNVQERQSPDALLTAGTIIGVIEINEPELPDSTAEDALMDITGVDGVIVMDRQFAKLNQEL